MKGEADDSLLLLGCFLFLGLYSRGTAVYTPTVALKLYSGKKIFKPYAQPITYYYGVP